LRAQLASLKGRIGESEALLGRLAEDARGDGDSHPGQREAKHSLPRHRCTFRTWASHIAPTASRVTDSPGVPRLDKIVTQAWYRDLAVETRTGS
jgi:hypothetical protein